MHQDFTPEINRRASHYFSIITNNKYNRLYCDEQFFLKIDADIPRDATFFSGGTTDQLYLCVRLSLIDMLFKDEKTAVILDQPFLQYDDMRKRNTVELFKVLSENRQILIFTGDKSLFSSCKGTELLTE